MPGGRRKPYATWLVVLLGLASCATSPIGPSAIAPSSGYGARLAIDVAAITEPGPTETATPVSPPASAPKAGSAAPNSPAPKPAPRCPSTPPRPAPITAVPPDPEGSRETEVERLAREVEEEAGRTKVAVIPPNPCIGQPAKAVFTNGWCGVVPVYLGRHKYTGDAAFSLMAGLPEPPVFVVKLGEAVYQGDGRYEFDFTLKADYGPYESGAPRRVEPGQDYYFVGYGSVYAPISPCR